MAIVLALTGWTPKRAADICGVSPELQRQWRKAGVLTAIADDVKRTKFNIISISFMYAARVLVDAGAGYKNIAPLINGLGSEILQNALLGGAVNLREPVSQEQAQEKLAEWGAVHLASRLHKRYFAFRTDPPSLNSHYRQIHFDDFAQMNYWLANGKEPETEDDNVDIDGRPIPPPTEEEALEDAAWREENPPEPPLPPFHTAVVIDAAAAAAELLARIGEHYAEVWDDNLDPLVVAHQKLKAEANAAAAELEEDLAELERRQRLVLDLPEGPEREAALVTYRADAPAMEARTDALMSKWKALNQKVIDNLERNRRRTK